MPQASYTRDRRGQHIGSEAAMARSYDAVTRSLVVRTTAGAVRYLEEVAGYSGASPARVLERSVTGDDAAPSATPPAAAIVVPKTDQGEVVFFCTHDGATQSFDLEVWAETDVHVDSGDVTSARRWVLVGRLLSVEPDLEYRMASGLRRVLLRVVNSSGVSGITPFTLYATTA